MAEVFYPVTKFRFKVTWDKQTLTHQDNIGFTEVSGLDYQVEMIEYRDGSDPNLSKRKIPGIRKFGNVTLKRGVFKSINDFYSWMEADSGKNSIQERKDYRRNVNITLMDETGVEVVTWSLQNAFPVKIQFSDMKADANEVCVDTIELAHEGITVEYI